MASDNFDRANSGTLGANWTNSSGSGNQYDIVSNQASNEGGNPCLEAYTAATPGSADYYSQVTLKTIAGTTDEGPGPAVRMSTAALTGYFLQCNTTEVRIYRVVAASYTQMGADFAAAAANDVVKLTVSGTGATVTLEYFKNGASQGTRSDSDASRITATNNWGMWYAGGSVHSFAVDDWSGDLLTAGGGGPTLSTLTMLGVQ